MRFDCTLFQYIGELCRYLVNSPPSAAETRHRLRLACGNGLRPDLWEAFQTRFRIPQILEFYGATEGNVNIFNFEGRPGAVGRVPWFVAHRFPIAVVRVGERARRRIYAVSAALTLVGILAMRWNVVIGGQLFSKSFLGYTTYKMGFATREGLLPAILIMLLPFAILAVLIRLLPPWAEEAENPVKA